MFDKRSDLIKFVTVVNTGKIHEAAVFLGTTQPALSRVIVKLEKQIGGQLFERLPSGVRLTALGVKISEQARHLLREYELAESEIASMVSGRTGDLRISAGPVWMHAIIPSAVAQFQQSHPAIAVQIRTASYGEGVRLLTEGHTDLHCGGFDSEGPLPEYLSRHHLMDMELGVMAHIKHPLFKKKNISYNELTEYPWLGYDKSTQKSGDDEWPSLSTVLDELFQKTGKRVPTIVQSDTANMSLMGKGPYLSYLSMNIAENFESVKLKRIPLALDERRFRAGIIARRSIEKSAVYSQFSELISKIVNEYV